MRTQRLLKSIHTNYADDTCTGNVNACVKRILQDIRRHVRTIDDELAQIKCKDPTFAVFTALRDGLTATVGANYEAIKTFGASVLPDENNVNTKLDLKKTYNDVYIALRRNTGGCFKDQMGLTQRTLEAIHSFYNENCTPDFNSNCFKRIIKTIKTHINIVNNEISKTKCTDSGYLSIFNAIVEGMTLPNTIRRDAIQLFGEGDLAQETMEFAQIYKEIHQLGDFAPCLREAIPNTLSKFESIHRSVQRCVDDACFKNNIDDLRSYFIAMQKGLRKMKCSCPEFDLIREKIRTGLRLSPPVLIDALTTYATDDIVDTTFDVADTYADISKALRQDKDSCFVAQMQKTKDFMESAHMDADNCSTTTATNTEDNTCYLNIIDKFREFFDSIESNLKGARCVDFYFDPIRYNIRNGLKLLDATLIDSFKVFAETSILTADFTLADVYKTLTENLNNNYTGCQKNFMILTQKTLENMHNNLENCPQNEEEQTACYNKILKSLQVAFLRMEDKLKDVKCVDPVFTPIRYKLRDAMKLSDDMLLYGIQTFANTAIDSERITPQFRKANAGAVTALDGCFKDEIQKIQKLEEMFQMDAQRCSEILKATDAASCYNSIYKKVNTLFESRDGVQCFNSAVSPLKPDLDNLLAKSVAQTNSQVAGTKKDDDSDFDATNGPNVASKDDQASSSIDDTNANATTNPQLMRRRKKKVVPKPVIDVKPTEIINSKSGMTVKDDTATNVPATRRSFAAVAKSAQNGQY